MSVNGQCHNRWRGTPNAGFAYVEVLVSVVLLAVLLAPALNALSGGILGVSVDPSSRHLALTSKMEAVLSKPFSELYAGTGGNCSTVTTAASAFSDSVGTPGRRIVVVYRVRHDNDNACTPSNTKLLMVKVYFEADGGTSASSLHTLTSAWW